MQIARDSDTLLMNRFARRIANRGTVIERALEKKSDDLGNQQRTFLRLSDEDAPLDCLSPHRRGDNVMK